MQSTVAGNNAGLVLAGGQGRRMGGLDKAALVLGDVPLLKSALDRLAPQVAAVAVAAGSSAGRFGDLDVPVLPDGVEPGAGPLAGVLAGLGWARSIGAHALVTVAVDTPFFPRDLAARLAEDRCGAPVAVATSKDRAGRIVRHPTCALWDVSLEAALARALTAGQRKVGAFLAEQGVADIAFPCNGIDPFFNINTPEDLTLAQALVESRDA